MEKFKQYFIARKKVTDTGQPDWQKLREELKEDYDIECMKLDFSIINVPIENMPKIFKSTSDFAQTMENLSKDNAEFCKEALDNSEFNDGKLNYYLILLVTNAFEGEKVDYIRKMIDDLINFFKNVKDSVEDHDPYIEIQNRNALTILTKYLLKFNWYVEKRNDMETTLSSFLLSTNINHVECALKCCEQIKAKASLGFINNDNISNHFSSELKLYENDTQMKDNWYYLYVGLCNLSGSNSEQIKKEWCVSLINAAKSTEGISKFALLEKALILSKNYGLNPEKKQLLKMLPQTVNDLKLKKIEIPIKLKTDKTQEMIEGFQKSPIDEQYKSLFLDFYTCFDQISNSLKSQVNSSFYKLLPVTYVDISGRIIGTYKSDDPRFYYYHMCSIFISIYYPTFSQKLNIFLNNPCYHDFVVRLFDNYEFTDPTNLTLFNLGIDEYRNNHMISALDILVSNFEGSFRSIVEQAGLLTSKIKQKSKDINQEFFSLSSLIEQKEVKNYFNNTNIIKMIKFIFTDEKLSNLLCK